MVHGRWTSKAAGFAMQDLAFPWRWPGSAIVVCSIVGGIIHLYATLLAYHASGYAAAFATLVFPFFAEFYWIAVIWSETGTFWHGLAVACIAYFVLCVMLFVAGSVVVSTSDQT